MAWQIFGTDAETARAGLGDLLSGFIGGSSAIDLSYLGDHIKTESLAKYVFLHSYAASKCKKGSNASLIGDQLSKLMRKTKPRLMSWKKQLSAVFYSFKHITIQFIPQIWSGY